MTVSDDAPAAISAEETDWLAIRRQMVDTERAQTDAIVSPAQETSSDHWASQAARFAQATSQPAQPAHFMRLVLPHLQPSDTVLDIGAGAGRRVVYSTSGSLVGRLWCACL
jgi:cyclopropane fatty-acyl-phospholipid synthase-like methyltransferase